MFSSMIELYRGLPKAIATVELREITHFHQLTVVLTFIFCLFLRRAETSSKNTPASVSWTGFHASCLLGPQRTLRSCLVQHYSKWSSWLSTSRSAGNFLGMQPSTSESGMLEGGLTCAEIL